jgi:hypothetical protein
MPEVSGQSMGPTVTSTSTAKEPSTPVPAAEEDERQAMSNPAFTFDHVHVISKNPKASADWYVEMFGARIAAAG